MIATCETCKFFMPPADDREVRPVLYSGHKECHRYPTFTPRHQDDWCGEYVAQPAAVKRGAKTA